MKRLLEKPLILPIPLLLLLILVPFYGSNADQLFDEDTPLVLAPAYGSTYIDSHSTEIPELKFNKLSNTKSIADFTDFLRESRNVYFTVWLFRIVQVNMLDITNKEKQYLINPIRWWKNTLGFQNKNRKRGDFEWKDGDSIKTNWVAHPAFGASVYLYYRARGYDRLSSTLGSVVQSTLFEYTIEGVIQSPSVQDLIITPGIGVPVGMLLEETSNILGNSNSGFLRGMSYIVNPMKIIVPETDKVNIAPLLGQQVVIGFRW